MEICFRIATDLPMRLWEPRTLKWLPWRSLGLQALTLRWPPWLGRGFYDISRTSSNTYRNHYIPDRSTDQMQNRSNPYSHAQCNFWCEGKPRNNWYNIFTRASSENEPSQDKCQVTTFAKRAGLDTSAYSNDDKLTRQLRHCQPRLMIDQKPCWDWTTPSKPAYCHLDSALEKHRNRCLWRVPSVLFPIQKATVIFISQIAVRRDYT